MSEIYNDYDSNWDFIYPHDFLKEPSEGWEVIGCMGFAASIFIALSAYVPAAAKKKRIYSIGPVLGPSVPQAAQVIEECVVEEAGVEEPRRERGYACSTTDRANIVRLFTEIADASTLDLVWKGFELRALGNRIEHVHPLALLVCVPKDKMRAILTSGNPMKTKPFMDNMTANLAREYIGGNLVPHIETFSQEFDKNEEEIRQLIQARDWANFVYYLFDVAT